MQKSSASSTIIHTDIPFRLDRLPWSRFHLLVVIGLGITWILDGLEVTIVGSLGPALQSAETLHLSSSNVGAVASFYVVGAVTVAPGRATKSCDWNTAYEPATFVARHPAEIA
jgi:hypothetical protein